ncbi:hypothetical protein BST14_19855 [Mycobacterium arosiense ATCC BAA-1401 = DSM 45069]|uniref:Uncharacterized protein n=1 Tax=Mycobacterium arosiense ATCC BAA-1401 = DSM 45069 TaxID=1265311 RepID=A0A1W9ZAQ1_MYCAI|nr:hypothetical protein BST14_19855 [Mycobacterium arosiense ATCC BAA-1401 = DSM 45069]
MSAHTHARAELIRRQLCDDLSAHSVRREHTVSAPAATPTTAGAQYIFWLDPIELCFTDRRPFGDHAGSGASQPVRVKNLTGCGWPSMRYCTENVLLLQCRVGRWSLP